MKTTIYELLGMIKDGKAPKKIKVFAEEMYYDEKEMDYKDNDGDYLFIDYSWKEAMNTWVEILEITITIDNKTINLAELKPESYYCPVGEKGKRAEYEPYTPSKDDKIEKIDEILRIDDLTPPYGDNEYRMWKNIIIQKNRINKIIDRINNE